MTLKREPTPLDLLLAEVADDADRQQAILLGKHAAESALGASIRQRARASLSELADVLNVHQSTPGRWERGEIIPNDEHALAYGCWIRQKARIVAQFEAEAAALLAEHKHHVATSPHPAVVLAERQAESWAGDVDLARSLAEVAAMRGSTEVEGSSTPA